MLSYVANHSKQRITTKVIKLQWIASISCQNDWNNAKVRRRSNYNELIDLTSKRSAMLSYVANHSKKRRTTKVIKLQWIVSISCQNDRNNAKVRRRSNKDEFHRFDVKTIKNVELRRKPFKITQNYKSNQRRMNLHRFDVKTIKNVELRRKPFKTTQNYKSNQITMNCIDFMSKHQKNAKVRRRSNYNELIDLTSKRSKMLSYVAKHSKQRRTTKVIKLQWIVSISCQKHQKNAKIQTRSNKDEFASIWRQNDQNVELRRKPFKTMQNNKSN